MSATKDLADFYEGKRVLVTGGASFIGSHLTELLIGSGASVIVADDLSSGKRENLDSVRSEISFLQGDLREPSFAKKSCEGTDVVFHLAAAHGGRGYIETHPVECLNNMSLDHTVFSAAVGAGASKIVFASSACTYPTVLQDSEDDRGLLREQDANFDESGKAFADGEYGWAKLVGELQLRAFHKQYGIDGIACRIFTAYGERENETHAVVALIAKAVARLDPFPIWGTGLQTRNFTHVQDTIMGLALSGARLQGFDTMNVGIPTHHTILELTDEIFRCLGWTPGSIKKELDKPVGVKSRAADVTKCRERLGWTPEVSLADGVARTIEWYTSTRRHQEGDLETALMER